MYVILQKLENDINLLFYEGYLNLVYTINVQQGRYYVNINFSPDGYYFVYSFNKTIYFYSIDFILIFTYNFEYFIHDLWISKNNDKIIINLHNDSVIIFDISLKEIVDEIRFDREFLNIIKFSNNILAEYDKNNEPCKIYLHNINNITEIKNFEINPGVYSIKISGFSSDAKYFYWSAYEKYMNNAYQINYFEMFNIYDLENDLVINPHLDCRLVQFVYFIPNTYTLVFKTKNNKIIFYDINSNEFTEFEYTKQIKQILLTDYNTLSFIGIDFIDFFDLDVKEIVHSIYTNIDFLFLKTNSMWYPSLYLLK